MMPARVTHTIDSDKKLVQQSTKVNRKSILKINRRSTCSNVSDKNEETCFPS